MTDRDALYRAIIANPDEDTPRFVFADWLEEHDEPEHAEFIRIGCQLEANTPDHPDYVEWLTRQEELTCWLATHAPGPQPKFPAGLELAGGEGWWRVSRRGFPRYVEFDGNHHPGTVAIRALAKSLDKAFATLPTRWLAVQFITNEQLAELLRQPIMSQLESLTLQLYVRDEPNDEAAQLVAECPHLKNLRGLNLAFDFGDAGVEALNCSEYLKQLERLTIQCDWRLPTKEWFPNLRELDLGPNFTAASFEQLCALNPLPWLHTLSFSGETQSSWQAFAKSHTFPALTRLELTGIATGGGHLTTLLGAKWFHPTFLMLDACSIDNEGARALAASPCLESVRWLQLRHNDDDIGASGIAAIAGSRKLANLKHLDLTNNPIGAAGLRAIAKNPVLRGLLGLMLGGSIDSRGPLTSEHFGKFLSALDMPELRYLSLGNQSIGRNAARVLTNPKFASLRRLDLRRCGLTDAAVKGLFNAPALQNLVELDLLENELKTGPEPLTDPDVMPRLGMCSLDEDINKELAAKLRKRPGLKLWNVRESGV